MSLTQEHTVHDVNAAVAHVARHSDPKAKAAALFDGVLSQIKLGIAEARTKPTVAEAIRVFEENVAEYERHRESILARLTD